MVRQPTKAMVISLLSYNQAYQPPHVPCLDRPKRKVGLSLAMSGLAGKVRRATESDEFDLSGYDQAISASDPRQTPGWWDHSGVLQPLL